jgi:TetR/AcrR family transcriptional repressor of nem operon
MNATQEKIVELARNYIQLLGYHSFNYKQIASQLNIKNAAIHHYYPAKEDLGLAVIEKDQADFAAFAKSIENATPTEKAEAMLQIYKQYFNDGHKMCLISSIGSSYSGIPEKMQPSAKEHISLMMTWMDDVFNEGLQSGEFNFTGTAEDMTLRWTTNLQGSLITGRLRGEEYFNHVLTILRASLKSA